MDNPAEQLDCVSLILCDDIYRDERTKKMVLVGTFNRVKTPGLPAVQRQLCMLVSITNGNGTYDLRVAIEHEATGGEVVTVEGPIEIKDPLVVCDVELRLQGVVFPEEGKYWISVSSGGRLMSQRPFVVERVVGLQEDPNADH